MCSVILTIAARATNYAASAGRALVQDVVPADDGAGCRQAGCDVDGGEGHEAWGVALGCHRRRDEASHRGEREAGAAHLGAG